MLIVLSLFWEQKDLVPADVNLTPFQKSTKKKEKKKKFYGFCGMLYLNLYLYDVVIFFPLVFFF